MNRLSRSNREQSGAALILILGIVALLSVMVIAFLGTSSKQLVATVQSNSVFQEQQLSELATSQFLVDIDNEIRAGSINFSHVGTADKSYSTATPPVTPPVLYYPATPLSATPDRYSAGSKVSSTKAAPTVDVPPNLLKQTRYQRDFYDKNLSVDDSTLIGVADPQLAYPQSASHSGSSRASAVSSGSGALTSGAISATRWNKPLLLPFIDVTGQPSTSGSFTTCVAGSSSLSQVKWTWIPPDWVYVTKSGSNPTKFDPTLISGSGVTAVVGRYAYQAYDVGGLLDLNVAGYSSNEVSPAEAAKKGSSGLADLTVLGLTDKQIQALLKFRNAATLKAQKNVGPYANNYLSFLLRTPDPKATSSASWPANNGFMRVGGLGSYSNRAFYSRQSLQSFLIGGLGVGTPSDTEKLALMGSLQYLTHFSRSLEQPSFKPGFYLKDTAKERTLSNVYPTGIKSDEMSPVFIRPSIVPPVSKNDDILYPINVVTSVPTLLFSHVQVSSGSIQSDQTYNQQNLFSTLKSFKTPYEMSLGNNRGGNDAYGTLADRSFGKAPTGLVTSTVKSDRFNTSAAAALIGLQDVINPSFLEVRVLKGFTRLDGCPASVGEPLVKKRFPLERLSWITSKGPSQENGGDSMGTKENIYKAFGLRWVSADSSKYPDQGSFWTYNHHGTFDKEIFSDKKTGEIYTLDELANGSSSDPNLPREPDFFELLYAAINVGSVGKSAVASHTPGESWDTATYQQVRDRTSRFQIMEIGANLIDQYDADDYPTIIKLPNPSPVSGKADVVSCYSPALFTARGIEDLPYFYRLHLRAIKNEGPGLRPAPDYDISGSTGITEISGSLSASRFRNCGTTSVIAFPEMWNPHAAPPNSKGDSMKFRVVAVSQTPDDVLNPGEAALASYGGALNQGLLNNPKMPDLSSPSLSTAATAFSSANAVSLWKWLSYNKDTFGSKPQPYFKSLWDNAYSYYDHNLFCKGIGDANDSLPYSCVLDTEGYIFHTTIPIKYNVPRDWWLTPVDIPVPKATMFQYSFFNVPNTITTDDDLMPIISGSLTTGSLYTLSGSPPVLALSGTTTFSQYSFNPANLLTMTNQLGVANWYSLNSPVISGVKFSSYNNKRKISLSKPPVANLVGFFSGDTTSYEFRGTELLFENSNSKSKLFREPLALCFSDSTQDPKLQAGPSNFFSNSGGYGGSILDGNQLNWVGFSLGETPAQYVSATRVESQSLVYTHTSVKYFNGTLVPILSASSVPTKMQMLQTSSGSLREVAVGTAGASLVNAWSSTWATGNYNSSAGSYLRTFVVPVNVVNLPTAQYVTLQVQYQSPDSVNWVTYDERYMTIPSGGIPVLYKEQITSCNSGTLGQSSDPPTFRKVNDNVIVNGNTIKLKTDLGLGFPVVASYDPRSSRFGHPVRSSSAEQRVVYGSIPADRYYLNPPSSTSGGFTSGVPDQTDRPNKLSIDSTTVVSGGTASLMCADSSIPAGWGHWMWKGADSIEGVGVAPLPFGTVFNAYLENVSQATRDAVNTPATAVPPQSSWWGQAKMGGVSLLSKPSLNAYDYGWYSRAYIPNTSLLTNSVTLSGQVLQGTASTDPTIPNFRNWYYYHGSPLGWEWDHADSLRIGCFSENVQPKKNSEDPKNPLYATSVSPEFRQAYADPDDVVRRAMGAFAVSGGYSSSLDGLPQAQPNTTNSDNRPVVLNRAFRSVADMGYAFRGSPWKNLSFSTPETGDAALLDVFCLSEPPPVTSSAVIGTGSVMTTAPLVAGKVNLNTRQENVLKALFSGALKDEVSGGTMTSAGSSPEVTKAAQFLIGRTTGNASWLGPLTNVSEIAGKLFGKDLDISNFNKTPYPPVYTSTVYKTATEPGRNPDLNKNLSKLEWHFTGFSADLDQVFTAAKDQKNLRMREAVVRALVDSGQTRVWNIMLDLIVQTGRLPSAATNLKQFVKEGEHRVWVFLAIDRLTGEVLDKIVEDVAE